jgi:hypothetical protein
MSPSAHCKADDTNRRTFYQNLSLIKTYESSPGTTKAICKWLRGVFFVSEHGKTVEMKSERATFDCIYAVYHRADSADTRLLVRPTLNELQHRLNWRRPRVHTLNCEENR